MPQRTEFNSKLNLKSKSFLPNRSKSLLTTNIFQFYEGICPPLKLFAPFDVFVYIRTAVMKQIIPEDILKEIELNQRRNTYRNTSCPMKMKEILVYTLISIFFFTSISFLFTNRRSFQGGTFRKKTKSTKKYQKRQNWRAPVKK